MMRVCITTLLVTAATFSTFARAADSENAIPSLEEIESLRMTGRYEAACAGLERILQNGALNADWYLALARILNNRGEYRLAIDALNQAITLDPRHTTARRLLGETCEIVGDKDQAIEAYAWFDALLRRSYPASAVALTDAGIAIHRHAALTQRADRVQRTQYVLQDLFQVAYERVDPQYWPARLAAADLLLDKYNLSDAKEDYEAALKIRDDLADAHVGLGWIALNGWKFEQVDDAFDAALKINPRSAPAHRLRASLLMTTRKFVEAEAAAEQALETNPNDLEALGLLSLIHI